MTTTNSIETSTRSAHSPNSYTREERFGFKAAATITMTIQRTTDWASGRCYVTWNANKGRGWFRGWKTRPFASEAEARAFADRKWPTLLSWLEGVTPQTSTGIPSSFFK